MLPDISGMTLCAEIRRTKQFPILMLTPIKLPQAQPLQRLRLGQDGLLLVWGQHRQGAVDLAKSPISLIFAPQDPVLPCGNGADALETLRKEKIDLAVLDVMLPDISGMTLCAEIRDTSPPTPFQTAPPPRSPAPGWSRGPKEYQTQWG